MEAVSSRALRRLAPGLDAIRLACAPYEAWRPKDALIYCDPPYVDAVVHYGFGGSRFRVFRFWSQVTRWAEAGNTVLVSETDAPDHAEVVWEKVLSTRMVQGERIERLYRVAASYR